MTMACAGDSVTAVKVEVVLAVARVDPDAPATLRGDRHLLVGGELKLILVRHPCNPCYGFVPTSSRPVFSSKPNIRFMFCTAWPAAPFTKLSIAEKTTICLPRTAKPISQKFVVFTQLISGEP